MTYMVDLETFHILDLHSIWWRKSGDIYIFLMCYQ